MRTSGNHLTIKDSEYEELSKLDIGSWFGKEWKEETIPLLSEVLDLIPKKKEIYIEVKTGTEITDQLIKDIYQHKDGWTITTIDNEPSAHFEHTIVVRNKKAEILSSFKEIEMLN